MGKNDIDDIFATKKKVIADPDKKQKKQDTKATAKTTSASATQKKRASGPSSHHVKTPVMPDDDLFTDLKGLKKRKTTEEGFKIYDDEELRIDPNAGNTEDCPFDCQCCF